MCKLKKAPLLLLIMILLMHTVALAQERRQERIHALKVTFITDKLKLSAGQAEKFWPVYQQYEEDLKALRRRFMQQYKKGTEHLSEQDARRNIEDNLDYQEQLILLKRRYQESFLKVISAKQLNELYVAEREFRQLLIQKLRERRSRR